MGSVGRKIDAPATDVARISSLRVGRPIVVSDWEGSWVTADHAHDVLEQGVPKGGQLFSIISDYDTYLTNIRKKEGYQPGDTLALIAPFLIAHGVEERLLYEVAEQDAKFIRGAKEAINLTQESGSSFWVVSTSYHQYVWHTAPQAGVPIENTRCTIFPIGDLTKYVREDDKQLVKDATARILGLGEVRFDKISDKNLGPRIRDAVNVMDNIFWEVLPDTSFGPVLQSIKPVGGRRKLDALQEILRKEKRNIQEAVVIGDSITDWEMLRETKQSGGLAISFNGNPYAIENANVAIISPDCMITAALIQIFGRSNIERVERVTTNWNIEMLRQEVAAGDLDKPLFNRITKMVGSQAPVAHWVTRQEMDAIVDSSVEFRKKLRGKAGTLS